MVELRKATATDTPVCESTYCCLGVSEWLPRPVSEQTHTHSKLVHTRQSSPTHARDKLTRIRTYPHASEPSHPSGWSQVSALTCRLISFVGVKWSCLRIKKQASPPLNLPFDWRTSASLCDNGPANRQKLFSSGTNLDRPLSNSPAPFLKMTR